MRHVTIVATVLTLLATALAAEAQMKPMTPSAQTQGQAPAKPQSPAAQQHPQQSQQPMMGGMMGGQGMMMCPMMGGMMGGQGMMGGRGMTGGQIDMSDPKAAARILRLRGDMMKAIGEVMLKHAEALAQEK